MRGERQEACCEGARCGEGQKRRPPEGERRDGSSSRGWRSGACLAPRKLSDEGGGLSTPAAAHFNCKDGEPAAARPAQLRVGALFGSSCSEQCGACSATPCPTRRACGGERGHQCRVDSQLGPSPKRQAVGNDLNAPVVLADRVDIEVPHQHIQGNRCTSLAADPCGRSLNGATPRP